MTTAIWNDVQEKFVSERVQLAWGVWTLLDKILVYDYEK